MNSLYIISLSPFPITILYIHAITIFRERVLTPRRSSQDTSSLSLSHHATVHTRLYMHTRAQCQTSSRSAPLRFSSHSRDIPTPHVCVCVYVDPQSAHAAELRRHHRRSLVCCYACARHFSRGRTHTRGAPVTHLHDDYRESEETREPIKVIEFSICHNSG